MNATKVKLKAVVLTQFMLAFGEDGREPNEAQRALVDRFAEDLDTAAESFPDEMDVSIIDDIYTLLDAIDEIPETPEDDEAAAALRGLGWEVVNPVDVNPDTGTDWLTCIIADLEAMRGCTAIALLPGHGESPGAIMEKTAAARLGMSFYDIEDLLT